MEFRYGGAATDPISLVDNDDLVVVRTRSRRSTRAFGVGSASPLTPPARDRLDGLPLLLGFDDAGVEVFGTAGESAREVRASLTGEESLEFAGRGLSDPVSGEPVVYTENVFVRFDDPAIAVEEVTARIEPYGLFLKRAVGFAAGSFFLGGRPGMGREVFAAAAALLALDEVALCHPELVRRRSTKSDPRQWHLGATVIDGVSIDAHSSVRAAWELTEGAGITIAVIDDGVDEGHLEFASPGKIVAARDATTGSMGSTPGPADHHGTACAGVACADGVSRASGVAPRARLMPIRLVSGLGSQSEAEAFAWAADNGADVISCSWGPTDGRWDDPDDPRHDSVVPLPDSTRLAIDYALRTGRGGRGSVICWAAGNGNESVDNDGYASHPEVVAVAACNDRSQRSVYSDFGEAIWCAFPSGDLAANGRQPLTSGIFTTDRSGADGYNRGTDPVDPTGDYTPSFSGTSSACPGAAGVAALVLSADPELSPAQVKDIIRRSCEQIDAANGDYDANGHSRWYGYGRVHARRAVELARGADAANPSVFEVTPGVAIPDTGTASTSVLVADPRPVDAIRIDVEVDHTWHGDLAIDVRTPGGQQVRLWTGTARRSGMLRVSASDAEVAVLDALIGGSVDGEWTLIVQDRARRDVGTIERFAIALDITDPAPPDPEPPDPEPPDPEPPDPEPPDPGPVVRERRPVTMTGWDPTLEAYADAVEVLQSRGPADPTSWGRQGAIHGSADAHELANQCQHASWYFLPWHRMYLHRFESIVRAVVVASGGPTDWVLPFWDYGPAVESRRVPEAFREPTRPDGRPNPLFVPGRSLNGGQPFPEALVSMDALAADTFVGAMPDGFGGPATGFAHSGPGFGRLENTPHNGVHVAVGGLMAAVDSAALDPLFWLHHCNIDRLWELWLGVGGANPADPRWRSERFELFDETGARVSMRVGEAVDPAALGYRYADAPEVPRERRTPPSTRRTIVSDAVPPEMVGAVDEPLVLRGGVERLVVPLRAPTRRGIGAEDSERITVTVEHISADGPPDRIYEVIVDGGGPGPDDDESLGTMSFFGVESATRTDRGRTPHGLRYAFDATAAYQRLRERSVSADELRITLRPLGDHDESERTDVRIGRVSVHRGPR